MVAPWFCDKAPQSLMGIGCRSEGSAQRRLRQMVSASQPIPTHGTRQLRPRGGQGVAVTLYTLVTFVAVDVIRLGFPMRGGETAALYGYVLLAASMLAVFGGACALVVSAAARLIARLGPQRAFVGWLLVGLVALVPAVHFARIVTAGQGIASSPWRIPLQLVVVVSLVVGSALLVGIRLRGSSFSAKKRLAVAASLVAVGGTTIAVTTFHSTTYIRVHQGLVLLASVTLTMGFALASAQATSRSGRFGHASALHSVGLLLLFGAGYPLTLLGGASRPKAGLVIFTHTIVAQKLTPLLFRCSPVYSSGRTPGSQKDFDQTRLSETNPPVVPPLEPGRYRGYNVVWISSDAFRADALGSRYHGASATPNLDAIANQALRFTDAMADYSHTSQSLLTVLSGRWDVTRSSKHRGQNSTEVEDRGRLSRLMRQAGYFTLANMMGGRSSAEHFGPSQIPGFDLHLQPGPTCSEQVESLEQFLRDYTEQKPLFLWMHLYDTHKPLQFSDEVVTGRVQDDYFAAVHHVDRCIGRAIAALKAKGLWDKTLFVFFADHGESLGEHDRLERHSTCYLHDSRIPLLFYASNTTLAREQSYRIQLSDLLPTTANLVGLNTAGEPMQGDDLSGLFERPAPTQGVAFSRGHPAQYHCASVLSDSWHLIYTRSGEFYELYAVDQDPMETTNLVGSHGAIVERLRPLLDAYFVHYQARYSGSNVVLEP